MIKNLSVFLPSPGDTIKELLLGNNMSIDDLALHTGFSKEYLNQLVNGKQRVTNDTAIKLSNIFPNLKPSFWVNLQEETDACIERAKEEERHAINKRHC